ncbi:MAG: glycosyltransferase [Blastocatellia bacterium]
MSWKNPTPKLRLNPTNSKPNIVFPASTVGRKGCYELREAIRRLDVSLLTLGSKIEGEDFWNGFDVQKGTENWLDIADLVVLPAFVEHKPRRLLSAVAHGIPIIASTACGVRELDGVQEFQAGDAESLRDLIIEKLCM